MYYNLNVYIFIKIYSLSLQQLLKSNGYRYMNL